MSSATSAVSSATSSASTADNVFSALLAGIVSGKHQAGERLPAERELARQLGASRPTLREALRRLSQWHMVEARRGSGVVVLNRNEWSFEALPAYMRYGDFKGNVKGLTSMVRDLLEMRTGMMVNLVRLAADRIKAGGTQLSRDAARRAWENRTNAKEFARAEFEMIRGLAESAGVLPAVWLFNSLGAVYIDLASSLATTVMPPDDFVPAIEEFLDCLDAGKASKGIQKLEAYLQRTDARMIAMLEAFS